MIAVIDYDAGNIRSVTNALHALNKPCFLTGDADALVKADVALLPGVGSFGVAMASLRARHLDEALLERFCRGKPTVGICLGLQLLFESSDESPDVRGLGIFKGGVTRLACGDLKIPHIGWTTLENCRGTFAAFENKYFYFVHSYAVRPKNEGIGAARAQYGEPFTAAVENGSFAACQFHPEKSGETGLALLKALLDREV